MNAKQALRLLRRVRVRIELAPEPEPDPGFSAAELERLRDLRERLLWTCEGCGGRLAGGNPPRCIGCQPAAPGSVG